MLQEKTINQLLEIKKSTWNLQYIIMNVVKKYLQIMKALN